MKDPFEIFKMEKEEAKKKRMKEIIKFILCKFVYTNYGEKESDACYNLEASAEEFSNELLNLLKGLNKDDPYYFFFNKEKKELTIYLVNPFASRNYFEEHIISADKLKDIDYSDDFLYEILEKCKKCTGYRLIYISKNPEMFAEIVEKINAHKYSMALDSDELDDEKNWDALRTRLMEFADVQ